MGNSRTSNSNKITTHRREANNIERLLKDISYGKFTDKEMESLIFLTNYVRTIPADEVHNFRIKKHTESWHIYKNLKNAFSHRNLDEVMNRLLIEHERYEVLHELTKD